MSTVFTLLEAWRHRDKLVNPQGRRAWLAQIAHYVARRLRHGEYRATQHLSRLDDLAETEHPTAIGLDFEQDLERRELATLLDHALALLPEDLRQAMVAHYIDEMPQRELAARLGISQGTLAVRLHRGRLRLQHLLATELSDEAALFGLDASRPPTWQETRLWCIQCGKHRLQVLFHREKQHTSARCPACGPIIEHQTTILTGARSFRAALKRIWTWIDTYYASALVTGIATCIACGQAAPVRQGVPPGAAAVFNNEIHPTIHVACPCGAVSACPMPWLGLASPTGQAFQRDHPRIHLAAQAEYEVDGCAARAIVFASATDNAQLVATISRDTYHLLKVQTI